MNSSIKNPAIGNIALVKIDASMKSFWMESGLRELPKKPEINNPTTSHQEPTMLVMAIMSQLKASFIHMMGKSIEPPQNRR